MILSPAEKEVCAGKPAYTNLNVVEGCEIGPASARQRSEKAFEVRQEAALFQRNLPIPGHPCNGDENFFPSKIGNYTKGLPHNELGEVNLNAYRDLIRALSTGEPDDFEFIPLGGVTKLVNPQAAQSQWYSYHGNPVPREYAR